MDVIPFPLHRVAPGHARIRPGDVLPFAPPRIRDVVVGWTVRLAFVPVMGVPVPMWVPQALFAPVRDGAAPGGERGAVLVA